MAKTEIQAGNKRQRRSRRDLGRAFSRLLCAIFALIGAIPLTGGLLLRSEPVQEWASSETSRLLRTELGMEASFSVELSLIPLRLAITDLSVPATDGGTPAVQVELAAVSPSFFSLLAGRLDVGDVELENTQIRLVVTDGEVRNVAYRLPSTPAGESPELKRAPFRSLAVTNVSLDLDIDGTRIATEGIDIDAFAEKNLSFDVALRTGGATIESQRTLDSETKQIAHDEDRLCAFDLRMFISKEEIVVRRLSLLGALDLNTARGGAPPCGGADESQIALRLSQTKIIPKKEGPPDLSGHVMARVPLALVNRLVPGSKGTGWAGFSGDIATGAQGKLPEVTGQLTGEGMSLDGYAIAEKLVAEVLITGNVIQVPTLYAKWGNGESNIEGIKIEPFAPKMPLSVAKATTKNVDFPGVMRDLDVTHHSWVDWNFNNTIVKKVAGTIDPFYIDGEIDGQTRDLVVWDRGFDDPARARMIGMKEVAVASRFRAHKKALEFYDGNVTFGSSSLPIDLVSIGWRMSGLVVRLKEGGGQLDFGDVSPIANVEVAGKSEIYVNLEGPNIHPILKGTLSAKDVAIGGYAAGNIEHANIHFEPLYVEFSDLVGRKGAMNYSLPTARLSFDGPSAVEFTAAASSKNFNVRTFFEIFHFDEDPRFDGIEAVGNVNAQVRYLLGGPEDTCKAGRLSVSGTSDFESATLFGEKFSGGNGQFDFDWFDIEASTHGMRVDVPSLALQKGSGTIFGSVAVSPGGMLTGDFVGTRIPVSRLEALGDVMGKADGFVTGFGQLSGTVDALAFTADIHVTELKAGDAELPKSDLRVKLVPNAQEAPSSTSGPASSCGRAIPPPYTRADYEADDSEGDFVINGKLFGGQVEFKDFSASRQTKQVLRGKAVLTRLDLGALSAFVGGGETAAKGTISGEVELEEFFVDRPYSSRARVDLTEAELVMSELKVNLPRRDAQILLQDGKIVTRNLALRATTLGAQEGILDAEVTVDDQSHINATLDLRPTDLGILAAALPGVERASGKLAASFTLKGPVAHPAVAGFIEVEEGKLSIEGFSSPVSDLFVTVALDDSRLHVEKGSAKWGGGSLTLRGEAPLVKGELGPTTLTINARSVTLPLEEEVRVSFDSDLKLEVPPPGDQSGELPHLGGEVNILSASYQKPMRVAADISTLAARGEKTEVEGYDETKDRLRLDVLVRSGKPLRVENALVIANLRIDPAGLRVTGTNQRMGAVGAVEVEQGGRVLLGQHKFEVQRGLVRFDDPTRMHPEVDVTAVTEYRRQEDRSTSQSDGAAAPTTESSGGAPVAGNWRIMMHAYGPPDDLKVDLNSDPPLAQDDIFLLLTVGLTRTELDQSQSSSVSSSIALEALGSLSGAERAVTKTVPVDEFRFGSAYSSRSGRTEPTVTIGKRLSRRMRASATTSLSDTSEVRANVEYRATENLSVEGSYDNAGDVASATGGNLGGDVRWRLEFE